MITTLAIKNYALIDDLRVNFHEGLSIITGETGAGKSILLGALSLLLGKRADLASVKDDSKKCVIEGEFLIDGFELKTLFDTNDLDFDVHTIIRREILPGGKSRAFVNDTPVNLVQLQVIAPYLVDIHSQYDTLALSQEGFQFEVIDALAGNASILEAYATNLLNQKELKRKLNALTLKREEANKELDYNTFLYNELNEANLQAIDQIALEEEYEMLSNSEEITEALSKIIQLLSDEQIGTIETAKEVRLGLSKIKAFSNQYNDIWERINSVIIELEDISDSVDASAERVESDPQKLFSINEVLQTLYKLQKKHNVATVVELVEIENQLSEKLDITGSLETEIAKIEDQLDAQLEKTKQLAGQLHEAREKAIPKLIKKLDYYMQALGIRNARFQFGLYTVDDFRPFGMDRLELSFSANKGGDLGPLKKVASGGELSRIMLAIKAILAQYKKLPTLIFDEIDTGVSGEIANKMAAIMGSMSAGMQVISITHLPQIAAKGAHHYKVFKEDINEVTFTRLRQLNDEERIVEIAQMIGGNQVTDAALANAKELLN